MAPVSNYTAGDGLPNIYSSSAPNTARTGAKESRFDPNVQRQVWGASVRPAPPTQQRGQENAPARSPSGGSTGNSDFSLPALTPRISAVTLPTSASAPLPNSLQGESSHDPTSAPSISSVPLSSIPTAASTGFTPSPPRGGSGGRSPGARPVVGNTPVVTVGAAAAFADLENENKMLEEIFDDAREIIGIERDMKKNGGEYVIQKRMTSTYEIAAHLGVESSALAPTTQHTYVLKDPHSLQRSSSPQDGPQTPRQVISSGGALAPTPSVMRRLSLAPFLDPNNSPLLSGRRTNIQPASPSSTVAPGSYTPRTPTLANVTTLTPRRYDPAGDKSRYAQLFSEQQAMEKHQKESNVQYQSMLETYFKLQEEMKRRLAEDPWEMQADDFEDATVRNLKRRLSELVGIPLDGLDGPVEPAQRSEVGQQQDSEDVEAA